MALGLVNTCAGLANLAGSAAVSLAPAPKSRVRVIVGALLFSMSTPWGGGCRSGAWGRCWGGSASPP